MHTTTRVCMVMIGVAMIGIFFGQVCITTAATTGKPLHTSSHPSSSVSRSTGKPHKVARSTQQTVSLMRGLASVYSDRLHGRKTSSGQQFSQHKMTAAHRSLPLGTKVLVTNLNNNKTVEVCINDRGPHGSGRVIDLSFAAAIKLGMRKKGFALVRLDVING